MSSQSYLDHYNKFEKIVSTQASRWKIKLNKIVQTEPDVAVAAWTLISSMEDLNLEPEQAADFVKRLNNTV